MRPESERVLVSIRRWMVASFYVLVVILGAVISDQANAAVPKAEPRQRIQPIIILDRHRPAKRPIVFPGRVQPERKPIVFPERRKPR